MIRILSNKLTEHRHFFGTHTHSFDFSLGGAILETNEKKNIPLHNTVKFMEGRKTMRVATRAHEHSSEGGLDPPIMNGGLWGFIPLIPDPTPPWCEGYDSKSLSPPDSEPLSDFPSCFTIIRRHFARAFWNHTCKKQRKKKVKNDVLRDEIMTESFVSTLWGNQKSPLTSWQVFCTLYPKGVYC